MITLDQGGRAAASARRRSVPVPLRAHVEGIWMTPGQRGPGADRWRVVADPSPHLIVHRHESGAVSASVVGPRSRHIDVDHRTRAFSVGVRFAPGALGPLTRLPASELRDRSASLAQIFGAPGRAAARRLEDATTPEAAADVLVALVADGMPDAEPDWRVRGFLAALGAAPGVRVGVVACRLGVSPRGLRETFREQVGLTPKRTQRVHRLLRALTALRRGGAGRGAAAALTAGYVDQAHFVRECRELLGEPPMRFLARARGADSYKPRSASRR